MKATRVRLLFGGLLLLLTPVLQAQTVMVYVSSASVSDDYLLSAVEAGVMDVFFDSGHIIFNAGTYERIGDSEMQRRYWVHSAARDGGATHAIELDVFLRLNEHDSAGFDSSGGLTGPINAAEYRFVRLDPATVLSRGRIAASAISPRGRDDAAFQLGVAVANAALRQ